MFRQDYNSIGYPPLSSKYEKCRRIKYPRAYRAADRRLDKLVQFNFYDELVLHLSIIIYTVNAREESK